MLLEIVKLTVSGGAIVAGESSGITNSIEVVLKSLFPDNPSVAFIFAHIGIPLGIGAVLTANQILKMKQRQLRATNHKLWRSVGQQADSEYGIFCSRQHGSTFDWINKSDPLEADYNSQKIAAEVGLRCRAVGRREAEEKGKDRWDDPWKGRPKQRDRIQGGRISAKRK